MKSRSLLLACTLYLALLLPVAVMATTNIFDPMTYVSNWLIPKDTSYNVPGWGVKKKQSGIDWETPGIVTGDIFFYRKGRAGDWRITLIGPRAGVESITLQSDKPVPKQTLKDSLMHDGFEMQAKACAWDAVLIYLTNSVYQPIWLVVDGRRIVFFMQADEPDLDILRRADLPQDFLSNGSCQF